MLRRILSSLTVAALMALPGCSNSSQLPTVPPPPPPGTVKEAPPVTALPEGVMKNRRGNPAPTTSNAL
jgi:hypothetical protein